MAGLCAFLMSAAIAAQAGQQAPAGTPAAGKELTFRWPQSIEMRVSTERARDRQQQGKPAQTTRSSASYRLRVQAHADGRLLVTDQMQFPGTAAVPADASRLAESLAVMMPTQIVSPAGEFVRLENVSAIQREIAALFKPLVEKAGDVPPNMKELFASLTSEAFLSRAAAQEWNTLIGTWTGFPLTGDILEFESEEPTAVFPDIKIPMVTRMMMTEKRPCARGSAKYECGVFQASSMIKPGAMEPLLKRMLEGVKGMADVKYETYDLVTVVTTTLELESMLPHAFSMVRTLDMTVSAPKDGPIAMKQTDRRTTTYSYVEK